ncbi:MAG: hypothetical protein ACRELG_00265 [Gemmataceae bacterium]
MIETVVLIGQAAAVVFAAGGVYWRLQTLESRVRDDVRDLRADVRAVHERINSEVHRAIVVPLKAAERVL